MAKVTRRRALQIFAAGGALVPLSYLAGVTWGSYPRHEGLTVLSDKEAAIVEAVAEVVIPDDNPIGITPKDIEIAKGVDQFVGMMPVETQSRARLLLWTVEHVFPVRIPYFRKFSRLTVEHRKKILGRFESSGGTAERALAKAMKGMIEMVYYNDPRVAEKIGYIGKCGT